MFESVFWDECSMSARCVAFGSVLVSVLVAVSSACADFVSVRLTPEAVADLSATHRGTEPWLVSCSWMPSATGHQSVASLEFSSESDVIPLKSAECFSFPVAPFPISTTQSDNVVELPAPPGGGALTLTGLMTLGGLHLGRSARTLRIGSPAQQFCHTSHPHGMGQPVDLDVDLASLTASPFAVPADHRPAIHRVLRDVFVPRLLPQSVLTLTAPRYPPA